MAQAAAQAPRTAEPQVTPAGELRDAAPEAEPATRIIPLEVSINGARAGSWVLMERGGALYAQLDAVRGMAHQPRSRARRRSLPGETWYPARFAAGLRGALQPGEQSLQLNFNPAAFATTRVAAPVAERPAVSRPLTTVFANYDLSYTRSDLRGVSATNDVGALTELGISGAPAC
jgi:hypothetical protein